MIDSFCRAVGYIAEEFRVVVHAQQLAQHECIKPVGHAILPVFLLDNLLADSY
jgi:hypothetical protein